MDLQAQTEEAERALKAMARRVEGTLKIAMDRAHKVETCNTYSTAYAVTTHPFGYYSFYSYVNAPPHTHSPAAQSKAQKRRNERR